MIFQSTLPEWAATTAAAATAIRLIYFNPRCPSGQRQVAEYRSSEPEFISIHAARVGSDDDVGTAYGYIRVFQSTLPEWAAT